MCPSQSALCHSGQALHVAWTRRLVHRRSKVRSAWALRRRLLTNPTPMVHYMTTIKSSASVTLAYLCRSAVRCYELLDKGSLFADLDPRPLVAEFAGTCSEEAASTRWP